MQKFEITKDTLKSITVVRTLRKKNTNCTINSTRRRYGSHDALTFDSFIDIFRLCSSVQRPCLNVFGDSYVTRGNFNVCKTEIRANERMNRWVVNQWKSIANQCLIVNELDQRYAPTEGNWLKPSVFYLTVFMPLSDPKIVKRDSGKCQQLDTMIIIKKNGTYSLFKQRVASRTKCSRTLLDYFKHFFFKYCKNQLLFFILNSFFSLCNK